MNRFFLVMGLIVIAYLASLKPSLTYLVNKNDLATVEVECGDYRGTGIAFKNKDKTYIWTCGHIVADYKQISHKVIKDGVTKTYYKFPQVTLTNQNESCSGSVIKYSDPDNYDLAIIECDFPIVKNSVIFSKKDYFSRGTEVYHLGTFSAWRGTEPRFALSLGIFMQSDRPILSQTFDLMNLTISKGCSGGGIYLRSNGECVGIVSRMFASDGCLMTPTRQIREWAKINKVEFALDSSFKPTTIDSIEDEAKEFNIMNFLDLFHGFK